MGDPDQIASATSVVVHEGPARGSRMVLVRLAGGVSFDVVVDRGMDIGEAWFGGAPLAWRSPAGLVAPSLARPGGFREAFGGGLLTTCGLRTHGQGGVDEGEELELHGSVWRLPAHEVRVRREWRDGRYWIDVEGAVVDSVLGGATLVLRRRISAAAGLAQIEVHDEVHHEGGPPAPVMLRHHFNLGYPLIRPGDEIVADVERVEPRGGGSVDPQWSMIQAPYVGAEEKVVVVTPTPEDDGSGPRATVRVRSAEGVDKLELTWSTEAMPRLVVWQLPRDRVNVLGLEPSSHGDDGRAAARASGQLRLLEQDERLRCWSRLRLGSGSLVGDAGLGGTQA